MSNKLHKLDCPFTQSCLITRVIYETARHMALSFLIIIIMRKGKEKGTGREEGENLFYYKQKLLPSVINSRHFFQLLLCCWHDEWHRHSAQQCGHGIQGKEGNAGAHTAVGLPQVCREHREHWPPGPSPHRNADSSRPCF